MNETPVFAGWMIVEIMGHRRLGGYVTEQQIAGAGFLRIDVPGPDGTPLATQFYPPASVYAITPCSEEAARAVAKANQPEPVHHYELPAPRVGRDEYPADPDEEADLDDCDDEHILDDDGQPL